jgi:HEPN domain-containing protein
VRSDLMAAAYLEQAGARLQAARRALRSGNHPFTVRLAQECVELSLKAALRLYGVEYPREHDLKPVLLAVRERFPPWFRRKVESLAEISSRLASERGPSMYGDEERGVPPTQLFHEDRAREALGEAERVYGECSRLYRSFLSKTRAG